MVGAPGAADAVVLAKATPSLRVGLHVVLVESRPLLPPERIPDLVQADGCFRTDMARMGAGIFFRRDVRAQAAAEIAAQFAAFAATGLPLDHVNAHKHFHLHPTLGDLLLEIGARYGMKAARVPLEPRDVLRRIEPVPKMLGDTALAAWAKMQRRRFARASVLTPDAVFGLSWSGAMTGTRLAGLIENLPPGLNEIYLHPATSGGFAGSAPDYDYAGEFAGLRAPEVLNAANHYKGRRGGFADFQAAGYNAAPL